MPPIIPDEGTEVDIRHLLDLSDPGKWSDALRFVNFQVLDHPCANLPARDGSAAAVSESDVPFFHDGSYAAESQENPHDR